MATSLELFLGKNGSSEITQKCIYNFKCLRASLMSKKKLKIRQSSVSCEFGSPRLIPNSIPVKRLEFSHLFALNYTVE